VLLANPLHPFHDVFFRIAKSFPAGNWFLFIINAENDTENEFVQSSAQKNVPCCMSVFLPFSPDEKYLVQMLSFDLF